MQRMNPFKVAAAMFAALATSQAQSVNKLFTPMAGSDQSVAQTALGQIPAKHKSRVLRQSAPFSLDMTVFTQKAGQLRAFEGKDLNADAARLPKAVNDARSIELGLFPNATFNVVLDRVSNQMNRDVWQGHVVGQPGSEVVLVINGKDLEGSITFPELPKIAIHSLGNGVHTAIEIDTRGLEACSLRK